MIEFLNGNQAVKIIMLGFDAAPDEIIAWAGDDVRAMIKRIGDRRGSNSTQQRHWVAFWEPLYATEHWEDALTRLVEKFGGWQKIRELKAKFEPEGIGLELDLPLHGTPYVASNWLSEDLVAELAATGLYLSVSIFDFDAENPTHHPVEGPYKEEEVDAVEQTIALKGTPLASRELALTIAEASYRTMFGDEALKTQLPLVVVDGGYRWIFKGSSAGSRDASEVAEIEVMKADCRVLRLQRRRFVSNGS